MQRFVTTLICSTIACVQVTIFTFFQNLDAAHNSFLAGLHMHVSIHSTAASPIATGRAIDS